MSEYYTKNFRAVEFRCKCEHCRRAATHKMQNFVLDKVQLLREEYGKPLTITSGYRCARHPSEVGKSTPGWHNKGYAVDIAVSSGAMAYELIKLALNLGCTGFALGNGFVHLDWRTSTPVTWKY